MPFKITQNCTQNRVWQRVLITIKDNKNHIDKFNKIIYKNTYCDIYWRNQIFYIYIDQLSIKKQESTYN